MEEAPKISVEELKSEIEMLELEEVNLEDYLDEGSNPLTGTMDISEQQQTREKLKQISEKIEAKKSELEKISNE